MANYDILGIIRGQGPFLCRKMDFLSFPNPPISSPCAGGSMHSKQPQNFPYISGKMCSINYFCVNRAPKILIPYPNSLGADAELPFHIKSQPPNIPSKITKCQHRMSAKKIPFVRCSLSAKSFFSSLSHSKSWLQKAVHQSCWRWYS